MEARFTLLQGRSRVQQNNSINTTNKNIWNIPQSYLGMRMPVKNYVSEIAGFRCG
jgi:hypothetical protein